MCAAVPGAGMLIHMSISSRNSGGSFLEGIGSHFPQQDVVIVHHPDAPDESRTPSRVQHQADSGLFNIDAPVYVGDIIEMPDPRGGVRRMHVTKVDITDVRNQPAFSRMSHINAHWTEIAPRPTQPATVYNGPVVNVTAGDHAQIAWANQGGVTQQHVQADVTAGYEALAVAVTRALDLLTTTRDVDPEDQDIARDAALQVLDEIVTPTPDRSVIRRGLATMRGLLATASTAAASEGGRALIGMLALPPQ